MINQKRSETNGIETKSSHLPDTPVMPLRESDSMLMSRIATVQIEIRYALVPIIGIIAIVPLVGALLSFRLAQWIVRPIVGLAEIADKVTMGDLETSVGGECLIARDEIGDLARSLERMRSSLKRRCCAFAPCWRRLLMFFTHHRVFCIKGKKIQ